MKIGIITYHLRNLGGHYQLLQLAQRLQKRGHKVTVYTLRREIEDIDKSKLKGLKIKSCNFKGELENKSHGQIVGWFLYIKYLLKINTLLSNLIINDDLELLNPHDWPVHWAAIFVKLRKKIKIVWTCNDVWHIPGKEELPESRWLFKVGNTFILQPFDKFVTHLVDCICVLSHDSNRILSNYYKMKTKLVRSGIDLDDYKKTYEKKYSRAKINLPQNSFVFLCLHSFFPHRRYEDAIEAFEKFILNNKKANAKLVISGSDLFDKKYAKKISNLVIEKNLKNKIIIRTKYMAKKEQLYYMFSADVFVLPHINYMWGLLAIEAMAVGLPCIMSDQVGARDVVEDKESTLIFKARDTFDLYKKMQQIYSDKKLRKKIAVNGKKIVWNTFSWEKYAQNMELVFKKELT